MNTQGYLDHLTADAARVADAVRRGPLDAPVTACPGWGLRELVVHLGLVHRWVLDAVATGAPPEMRPEPAATSADELADWLVDGATELAATLAALDPDAPTWHPFPVPKVARVWPRRQAVETVIHRWDAEQAVGEPSPIDPELASDAIDEYFEVGLPRLVVRGKATVPSGSFHVHCTDVPGEWLVTTDDDGALVVRREHAKGDAALRGPAEAILLRLWDRPGARAGELEVVGDAAVADAWLSLPGM